MHRKRVSELYAELSYTLSTKHREELYRTDALIASNGIFLFPDSITFEDGVAIAHPEKLVSEQPEFHDDLKTTNTLKAFCSIANPFVGAPTTHLLLKEQLLSYTQLLNEFSYESSIVKGLEFILLVIEFRKFAIQVMLAVHNLSFAQIQSFTGVCFKEAAS